jgi:hypothetical protein
MSNCTLPPKLQPLVDTLLRDVRRMLAERGEVPATMFLFGDELIVHELNTDTETAKDIDALMLRHLAKLHHCDAAVLVAEGWTLPPHLQGQREAICARYGSVSACPDRVEIVFLGIESREGNYLVEAPLVRKGRAVTLGELSVSQPDGEGRFHKILPPL